MKKIAALLAASVAGLLALAGPASATGGGIPSPDNNKKVTLCHATASETNPYVKITVSVNAFYNAGHIDHVQGGREDIYEGFTWTDKKGVEHVVPSQGDTSLLAFEDCQKPKEDTPVTKPAPVFNDQCETKDDTFSVAPGEGYSVGPVVKDGLVWSITVTLLDGFKWADGSKAPLVFEHTFTDIACDLPETGMGATYATGTGVAALAGVALLGGLMLAQTRRSRRNV